MDNVAHKWNVCASLNRVLNVLLANLMGMDEYVQTINI